MLATLRDFRRVSSAQPESTSDAENLFHITDMWDALNQAYNEDQIDAAMAVLACSYAMFAMLQGEQYSSSGMDLAIESMNRISECDLYCRVQQDDKFAALFTRAFMQGNNIGMIWKGAEYIRERNEALIPGKVTPA